LKCIKYYSVNSGDLKSDLISSSMSPMGEGMGEEDYRGVRKNG